MKADAAHVLVAAALGVLFFAAPRSAASFDLQNLGSVQLEVPVEFASMPFTQTAGSLDLAGSFSSGGTVAGLFLGGPQDWSLYSDFALRMTLSGTNPELSFSVGFFSYNPEDPENPYAFIDTYGGFTLEAGASPADVLLSLSIPGTGDYSSVAGMQFTWDTGGSIDAKLLDIVALSGPAPPAGGIGSFTVSAPGGFRFLTGQGIEGAMLEPDGSSWNTLSDSNAKTAVTAVDHREVLRKVSELPVTAWRYGNNARVNHLGPMAQDFHEAFGLGADNQRISTLDADGVALSAVKGLIMELQDRKARSAAQAGRIRQLQSELDALQRQQDALPPVPAKSGP